MRRRLLVLLAVALALVFWFALGRDDAPSPAQRAERELTTSDAVAPSLTAPTLASAPDPTVSRAAIAAEPVGSAGTPALAAAAPADTQLAEVRGRFLLSDGGAASGVAVGLRGWNANNERVMKYGQPQNWENPSTVSAADGRFTLRFDPPRAYQFVLAGNLAGHAAASWRWSEIEPGKIVDVGDVTLAAAGSIRARIVDSAGVVLNQGWHVHAEGGTAAESDPGRRATRVNAVVEPTGWATLEGVPPGSVILTAYSRIANWIDGPTVSVRAGETVEAEILYTGPDNLRRIVVLPFSRPFHVFSGGVTEITLSGPGIAPRAATKVARSSQSFSFEDLEPGSYSVQIDDPRFLPWRADGVEPGSSVDAKLKGSAAVILTVVDAATGANVERYEIDVRFDGAQFGPSTFRVLEKSAEPPAGGLFDGLVPFDQTLIVRADGYAPYEAAAPALAANETRALAVRLTRGVTVSGVVRARGSGAPHADVAVALRRQEKTPGAFRSRSADDPAARSTRTDAAGRFAFDLVGDGAWIVEGTASPTLSAQRDVTVANGAASEATIEFPPSGVLVGRLIGPAEADWSKLAVLALPRKPADAPDAEWNGRWIDRSVAAASIAADGTFRTQLLPTGSVDVSLRLPDARIPSGFSGWSGTEGGNIALELLELEPGENRREYDVRDRFPGGIDVAARVNGEPTPGLVVQATSTGPESFTAVSVLDANGKGALRPLAVATYRFVVNPIDGAWRFQDERVVQLAANGSATIEFDIRLVDGTLAVVDAATRAPLAGTTVRIGLENSEWPEIQVGTDGEGRIRTRLALGRYALWSGTDAFQMTRGPSFEWTTNGPMPATVALTSGS